MSYLLSTFTEVAEIDSRITSGVVTLPLTSSIPNRTFTVKDFYGAASNSTIILQTQAPDVFENGLSNILINNNFGAVTLYSGETGTWNVLTGSIQNSMTVSSFVTSTMAISSYTFAINSNSFTIQHNASTLLRLTQGNINVSSITLSSFSIYDSGLLSNVNIRLSSLTLLANNTSIGGGGSIDTTFITSTVAGLGQRYVSTPSLVSTVIGLGQTYISSILVGSNYINSTVAGLGQTYVSTPSLTSTVIGLGQTYISTLIVNPAYVTSTIIGLGQTYISTPSLTSTVAGLGQQYLSTSSLLSTVAGLGQTYLSTPSLQSTVAGLGQTYISAPLNIARISSLTVSTLALSTFSLFTQGPSSLVITNSNPGNFIVSSMNLGINTTQPLYPLDVNGVGNFSSISLGSGNASMLVKAQSLAIGYQVGTYGLAGTNTLSIGYQAGFSNQGNSALALGQTAGSYSQGLSGIAVGNAAGFSNQGLYGTAVGYQAGFFTQSNYGVAVGYTAGYSNQGSNAVAIGNGAGFSNQSTNSIAIGWLAGQGTTATSSIILNASGAALNTTTPGLFVSPVRFVTGAGNIASFNTATSEIAYSDTAQLSTITTVRLGVGAAANASNALLVSGTQSNTGNMFIGGTSLLVSSSNIPYTVTTLSSAFSNPHSACIDPTGTILYVTNNNTSQIFSVVIATSVVTVLSTSGSTITSPSGICIDPLGQNLYVCSVNSFTIFKITLPGGVVTVFAGSGSAGSTNGTGTGASFGSARSICINPAGTVLYLADTGNTRVRAITVPGAVVTTVITGFTSPYGICINAAGTTLYVADSTNNTIYSISIASPSLVTVATTSGSAQGINIDPTGLNLYITRENLFLVSAVVISTGVVTNIAGSSGVSGGTDGPGSNATFNGPQFIVINSSGNLLYVLEGRASRIRTLSLAPSPSLSVAGGYVGIGAAANTSNALLVTGTQSNTGAFFVGGLATFVNSSNTGTLGVAGVTTLSNTSNAGTLGVAGVTTLSNTSNTGTLGVAGVTTLSNTSNTGTLTVSGAATLGSLAVNGTQSNTGNLVANANLYAGFIPGSVPTSTSVTTLAKGFNNPHCGCIDPTGTILYFTNFNTSQIYSLVIATGVATVLSTSGTATTNPTGICIDPLGQNLYVFLYYGNSILKITLPGGVASVFAGGTQGSTNGTGTGASFYNARSMCMNSAGTVMYLLDTGNNSIRAITVPGAVVTTVITGFNNPFGICINAAGTILYVAEYGGSIIYSISIASPSLVTVATTSGNPVGIALDTTGLNLYITRASSRVVSYVVISSGVVTTIAGTGVTGSNDGPGTSATFGAPQFIVTNLSGNILYVLDNGANNTIRSVALAYPPSLSVIGRYVGIGAAANTSNALLVTGDINYTGTLRQNGTAVTFSSPGINSSGNIGINSASNASYALLVTGAQSNTSTLSVTANVGIGAAANTSNALLVTGSQSNTGALFVGGAATFVNSSNTGTLGVAGITTLSSNVGIYTGSTSAQLDIRGGAQSDGTLGSNMLAFQYSGGGFRHFITSRHNAVAGSPCNAIEFWLNNGTASNDSLIKGTCNVNAMCVTATGVGINCNTPLSTRALDVNGSINFSGSLFSNGTLFTASAAVPGINSTGNVGINSASNASYSLLVTGAQSNTGALSVAGLATFVNSSNTGTLGVAGLATFVNSSNTGTLGVAGLGTFVNTSNTGTLGVAGLATFVNSSNTGTLGVAGTTTFSSNVSTRSFTNGRFEIYPATTNNYTIMGLSGGNTNGYIYGDYQLLGDGIHMGYNYYASNGVAYSPAGFAAGCSRISMNYGAMSLNIGFSNTLSTMVGISGSRVSIAATTTDFGFYAPTPSFVSSIAFTSTYNDLLNGSPAYGIGRASSGITGLGPYTVAAGQLPLQIANYHGINFVGGQALWGAGVSHMAIVDGKVGVQNPAPSYTLDVNGPMQAAIYYSTISAGGTQTVTPNNFGIFYNITTSGTFTLAFAATQAASNIGKYICVRNNCGSTLSFTLTGVSGIASPVTLSNAQSATFVVATTTTYALF